MICGSCEMRTDPSNATCLCTKDLQGWSCEDPRFTYDNHRNLPIIVIKPDLSGKEWLSFYAEVSTDHVFCVFSKNQHIGEGDDWPEHWLWIRAPKITRE